MSAVAELERKPAARRPSRQRAVAAAVEEPQREQPFPGATGRQIVQDNWGLGWPEWAPGDMIEVNFDATKYRGEGMYIVERFHPDAPAFAQRWTGMLRLAMGTGGIHARQRTEDGHKWVLLSEEQMANMKFIGSVHTVYRNTTKWRPGLRTDGVVKGITAGSDGMAQVQVSTGDDESFVIGGISLKQANMALGPLLGQRVNLILETEELTR